MSYTTLPTRGALDLQPAITDVRAPAANELSADSIEAIKDRIIEIGTAVGIDAGTGASSLRRGYLPTLLQLAGVIAPTALAADANDYAPTGNADATVWALSATGAMRTITGISGGASGRVLVLVNVGGEAIKLTSNDAASTAANRLSAAHDAPVILQPSGGSVVLAYYSAASRWVRVADLGAKRRSTNSDPGVTNDAAEGYEVGSIWVNSSTGAWLCLDATEGAAAWFHLVAGTANTYEANVRAAVAQLTAALDVNAQKITDLAIGTSNTDAAHVGQVQQPAGRTDSDGSVTIAAGDIGNVVFCSNAGAVTVDLPDLSGSLISGRAIVITIQGTNAATVITVDPGASVTIDGSASNFVAATGKARVSLISLDGLAFYSGTP